MIRLRATVLSLLLLAVTSIAAEKTLDVYFIDVEGGQSTLMITPAGQTMLIDAGYGQRNDRDPHRIMAVLKEANVDHLDYLLVTHFHPDHVGGVPTLAARIPIGTFIDYGSPMGTDRMATGGFRAYEPIRALGKHIEPLPGDTLPLDGLDATVVSAAGELIANPLPGAGQKNATCATLEDQDEDGTENFRSIGVRFKFGKFTFVDLGDLSGNTLGRLVCPVNLVGNTSVYLISHHGNYDTDVPAVLTALRPQVAIMNNSARKGGAPSAFANLRRQPGLQLWQLHASFNEGVENTADDFIANVDDGTTTAFWLKLSASADGQFSIQNSRTRATWNYLLRP